MRMQKMTMTMMIRYTSFPVPHFSINLNAWIPGRHNKDLTVVKLRQSMPVVVLIR